MKLVGGTLSFRYAKCQGDLMLQDSSLNRFVGPDEVVGNLFLLASSFDFMELRRRVRGHFALNRVVCRERLIVEYLTADARTDLEEVVVAQGTLRQSTFRGVFRSSVTGRLVDFENCRFDEATDIAIHADELALRGSRFEADTVLTGSLPDNVWRGRRLPLESMYERKPILEFAAKQALGNRWPSASTKLVDVDGARLDKVHIESLDLSKCRFRGALGLDGVRIGNGVRLPQAPITRRVVLADEIAWRAAAVRYRRPSLWLPEVDPPQPTRRAALWARRRSPDLIDLPGTSASRRDAALQVAAIYRSVRSALEDRKDQPGAADFYYGGMQMRRAAKGLDFPVLTAYWLTSGYGTRAARALVFLLIAIIGFAALFSLWGFDPKHGLDFEHSVLFAARGAANTLQRDELQHLSDAGDLFYLLIRILGPVMLGFIAFALRSKVKR